MRIAASQRSMFSFRGALSIGVLFLALALPFIPMIVQAQSAVPGSVQENLDAARGAQPAPQPLAVIIGKIINAALSLLGIIFVVMMVWAGFLWMTDAGSSEQVKKAKTMLRNAIIGLIIILLAYSIAQFVIDGLVNATSGPLS
jgi:uncharacterized membrane protein YwzB